MAINYDSWTQTYDTTRSASPSVLGPISKALGPADGRVLLDVGGGTGNFARPLADAGFTVFLVDISRGVIRRASHYFPDYLDHAPFHNYRPLETTVEALRDSGFSRVEVQPIHYTDVLDGSFQALKHQPEAFFDDARLLNTAAIMRISESSRGAGIARIRADHQSGRLREVITHYQPLLSEFGDGSVFVATP